MPAVSYGRLGEMDLLQLWESETCRFYRERFVNRIQAFDAVYVKRFVDGAASRANTDKAARRAMPSPPEGCDVCHYLYNI